MSADGPVVNVHVLFFAKSRELANTPRSKVDVPTEVTASDLLDQLVSRFGLTSIRDNLILAHNESYIENLSDKILFKEGDELAVIPPLSGG
ncbi:molybdopterin synthase sulfur carrier subunit [Drosophila eugracilis]|uniref:molybdopterin synthase sulfur carrier subunit n=1 Tax=Drosophila eugracilis TaxID=29029 RepID=UPI0007E7CBBC|nr:molybdopterin synthase sulfur carrier subunit [Drosophila eugracilis]